MLRSHDPWIAKQQQFFAGNIVAVRLLREDVGSLNVVLVYSPAWPIDPQEWSSVDVSDIKLKKNPDIWCTEILWRLLRDTMQAADEDWIVAGDFNSSPPCVRMIWYQPPLKSSLSPGLPGAYHDGNVQQRVALAGGRRL
jgi:hypothetical protein